MRNSVREATAYHEAGHMVAAWRCGVKIRQATIKPSKGFAGQVEHESPLRGVNLDLDASDRANAKLDKAVLICFAGPAAQRRFRPRSWRDYHGGGDYKLASDLALRRNGSGEIASAYLKWVDLQARSLIEGNWEFVVLFAERLLKRETLLFSEISDLIQQETAVRYDGALPVFRTVIENGVERVSINSSPNPGQAKAAARQ